MKNGSPPPLFILVVILIIDLLSFTLILPLFPSIIDHFAKEDNRDFVFDSFESIVKHIQRIVGIPDLQRYNNVFYGGVLGSLYSFLQFLSSPIFGRLSDKYGRKPLLIISIVGSTISYFIWSISSNSFLLFIISRIIGGLSKASVSMAITIVSDICPGEKRGLGMAFVGMSFSIAFLVGPSIGAYFSVANRQSSQLKTTPANISILLSLIELALTALFLAETLPKKAGCEKISSSKMVTTNNEQSRNDQAPKNNKLFSMRNLLLAHRWENVDDEGKSSLARMRTYARVYFLFTFLFSALEFTIGFLTHTRFGFAEMQQGRIYLFSGVIMIIIQGGIVRRIPCNTGSQTNGALAGLFAIIPAYILMGFSYNQLMLYMAIFLYAIASSTVVPFLTTLFSLAGPESSKGENLGTFRSIGSLARACGPIFGSSLFWLMGPELCYLIGGFALCAPFLMILNYQKRNKIAKMKIG